jgi:hypothetical protein
MVNVGMWVTNLASSAFLVVLRTMAWPGIVWCVVNVVRIFLHKAYYGVLP